jgi:fructokinase
MSLIVGIGELLWDVYHDGRKVAGGAPFNFTCHCHNLGHRAVMVSAVGDDELGRELRARVRELGLTDDFIQTDPRHPTGTVRVTVDAAGQPSYEIVEDVAWDHIAWMPQLEALAGRCDAVCYGTLGQRHEVSGATIPKLLSASRFGDGGYAHRVFDINLRQHFYDRDSMKWTLYRSHTVKVNAGELRTVADLFGWAGDGEAELVRQLFQFSAAETRVVIVTDGEHGCRVYPERGDVIVEPSVPAAVVDTVGAGDAFTAAMVCLTLEGKPLAECARFAIRYAAKVCESAGGTPRVDRADVK